MIDVGGEYDHSKVQCNPHARDCKEEITPKLKKIEMKNVVIVRTLVHQYWFIAVMKLYNRDINGICYSSRCNVVQQYHSSTREMSGLAAEDLSMYYRSSFTRAC